MGIEHALRQSGVEVCSIASMFGLSSDAPGNWLSRIKSLYQGRQFDQVWIELVHTSYDDGFLSWIETLAPVRLGFVMESLQYEPHVYEMSPHLKTRKEQVVKRLKHMTHVLLADEQDATDLNLQGGINAMWWPQTVPAASIQAPPPVENSYAVFYGALYGNRQGWLTHPALAGLLVQPGPSLEYQTSCPEFFDRLQQIATLALNEGLQARLYHLNRYLSILRSVREQIFSLWLGSLQQGSAVVNLPSFFQGFPGRVYEGMAAGRPVISCTVPGRPRTNALFTDGEDILLYDPNSPEHLAEQIRRVQTDAALVQRLTSNATRKMQRSHTAEIRVSQILRWLDDGVETDFTAV
ncbi:glycosyltransferase [Herbaspirillum lusitanum]|uniref:Glycosyltransferase n=1 Tax=Herbaspirillum lusitanum TaxID=213312 RepID=A0ABW9A5G9_9BURK